MKRREETILWTIEELYNWAKEHDCEQYTVFGQDEGMTCNLNTFEFRIVREEEIIYIC